jgi:CheY-like chemotaxis protein
LWWKGFRLIWRIGCKGCDLIFPIRPNALPKDGQRFVVLRCPYCSYTASYEAAEIVLKNDFAASQLRLDAVTLKPTGKSPIMLGLGSSEASMATPETTQVILLVEDNVDDARLVTRAFERAGVENPVRRLKDGEEAMAYLAGIGIYADRVQHPIPAVILLDLNMTKFNGYQLMVWLRTQPEIKRIPVIVLTESRDAASINRAYDAGANSYLVKPGNAKEIGRIVELLQAYWISLNERPRLVFHGKAGN